MAQPAAPPALPRKDGADQSSFSVMVGQVYDGPLDLLLTDAVMPGKSGIDLLPVIKALPSPPMVVILTSHPTEHHRRLSLAQGADFFFDKSLDFARVVELVAVRVVRPA